MIPRLKPALGFEELGAAVAPSGSGDVEDFERGFAAMAGQRHAVAFPYGRTALMMLLEALGLQGREVICPAYTCVVVPHAIVHSGNEPVFVDSRDDDFNMDLARLPEAINGKTGAIIATSLFGHPVDLDALDEIRRRHPSVRIIQDCAHSFTASFKGRPVHKAGDAALFSFNVSKLVTSIFGGMITTDDDSLAEKLRGIRDRRLRPPGVLKSLRRFLYLLCLYPAFSEAMYGLVHSMERARLLDPFVRYYDESLIDMPADHLRGMASIEARVGSRQIEKYPEIIARRRRLAADYGRLLKDVPGLRLPPIQEGATYSHYVPRISGSRERLLEGMRKAGIQLGILIEYSIPEMPAYRGKRTIGGEVASRLKSQTINLPVHFSVDAARRDRIVAALRACLGNERA